MNSGRWRETWSPRTSGDVSNLQRNHRKSDDMVAGVVGIMHKTVFEEEFPLLGAEDKHGNSELGRVLSSSSSTYRLLTDTSSVIVSNGLSSTSDEIPMTVGSSSTVVMMHQHTDSASAPSIAPGTMGLSMAETLAQSPSHSHTRPQVSLTFVCCVFVTMFSLLMWYVLQYSYLLVLKSLKSWPLSNLGY